MDNITEMLKGVLEGSILQILDQETTYGYDITQKIQRLGFSDVVEGTVYTILVRLERNGYVIAEKKASEVGPPRKFYTLTDTGRQELRDFWMKWDFVSSKINELRSE